MIKRDKLFTRLGKLGADDDRGAEYEYWAKLGDTERFRVTWELVVQAHEILGQSENELRLQRSVENIKRTRS